MFFNFKFLKINKHVDFPIENLKFNAFVDPNSDQFNLFNDHSYELYGICFHIGSQLHQGHYTSIIFFLILFHMFKIILLLLFNFKGLSKNAIDNKWRYYNDSNIPFVVDDVHSFIRSQSLEPYVLFYRLKKKGKYFFYFYLFYKFYQIVLFLRYGKSDYRASSS